ncbi:A/G-specific adenine glycosylase [Flavobacterium caeni]|uniref:Adenine DNA glycosylase n=1 Tax=Flavobacterium caeni TaxID=490189 RepID=A0A1G5IM09_9FLAO|nr:A/G-specific adenine glycosylase [Flavobacterium caeni]SCY76781.1 A/G-specific DNA-adenine glycosylase [Flavobacterium caeni]
MNFTKTLIVWYLQYKRALPWRDTQDPYAIWLSEIMLQQTRVAQGMPYFFAFTEAFPTVSDLANASEEKVLKLWQGLGYYSRARNLHKTAKIVAFEMGGNFPDNYADLLQLKGVGEYTAAAIASFSFNEAVPVVDGNVFRVLSRFFGIATDISGSSAKKEFAALAFELMPKDDPATFNQALMEFGALQCVPKNPDCGVCSMNVGCLALQQNKVDLLPVKSKKTKVTTRFLNYLVLTDAHKNTVMQQRTGKGIWRNLYEFPLVETPVEVNEEAIALAAAQQFPQVTAVSLGQRVNHKLTHQNLNLAFWEVRSSATLPDAISQDAARALPVPIVIHNFIERHWR